MYAATLPPMSIGVDIGVVDGTIALIDELMRESSTRLDDISLIGVGIPGVVEPESGTVSHGVNVGIGSDPIGLRSLLAQRLGRPARVNNDVNVAALGAARELHDQDPDIGRRGGIAYLGVGTGIAAAWVLEGKVWSGANGAAGEVGHISIDPNGPVCECGQRGCIEAISSGSAIERSWPVEGGSPIEHLIAAAETGRGDAIGVWDSVVDGLARAVYIMMMSIDPHVVVLGGGIANHGDRVVPAVAAALRKRALGSRLLTSLNMPERLRHVRHTDRVGVVGAVIAASTAETPSS
jgi:glucokinase